MHEEEGRVDSLQSPLEAVIIENVKGLLRSSFRDYFDYIETALRAPDMPPAHGEDWQQHKARVQRAIWAEIGKLPFGEVSSYGELGLATGRLTAGRAVGGAVGANPIPIIVPCHRVLATNRRITGYSGGEGIPTKSWLLTHEGIEHVA